MSDSTAHREPQGRRVRLLPAVLANQIAAGEVVERPASVLKELLENSLDAGAQQIDIDLERGGVSLVRVRDDGAGIEPEDLTLALSRHATSKIGTLDDLESVMTLGFRGEALPSIASVARLRLASRRPGALKGWSVQVDGSAATGGVEPAAMPPGTLVEVRELFFNTPARRKFLRTEKTELHHLEEVVRRVALSRFDVGFRLSHNGRVLFNLRPARSDDARVRRVAKLCGQAFCTHAAAVDLEGGELRLRGWVASPELMRRQGDLQHVFLNGRSIKDRVVNHAVRQAYGEQLADGYAPAYVLYLEINPNRVDVNVHPSKHEVRFRDSRGVHDFLLHAVSRALEPVAEPDRSSPSAQQPQTDRGSAEWTAPARSGRAAVSEQLSAYGRLGASSTASSYARQPTQDGGGRSGEATVCGQVEGRYLVVAEGERFLLIDWFSAAEDILHRRLRSALENDGAVRAKPLLVPATVELDETAVMTLDRNADVLDVVGVRFSSVGPGRVSLRQVPAVIDRFEADSLTRSIVAAMCAADDGCDPFVLIVVLARHAARQPLTTGGPGLAQQCQRMLGELEESHALAAWSRVLDARVIGRLFGEPSERQ